jgi:hypothetical protein
MRTDNPFALANASITAFRFFLSLSTTGQTRSKSFSKRVQNFETFSRERIRVSRASILEDYGWLGEKRGLNQDIEPH